jgi:hypothetical protein
LAHSEEDAAPVDKSDRENRGCEGGARLKANRRKESIWLAAVGLFIAVISVPMAVVKPLTNDEIYTFAVARQPGLRAILTALTNGVDIHPPLDYWLRHLAMQAFGSSPLVFRLPSLIAVCIAGMLLFRLISRRLSFIYGIAGVLFVLLVCGLEVASIGRPYALLLCAFSAALYAWDWLATEPSSNAHRVMFVLALATAMYSHYYGALYFVAFGAAAVLQGVLERKPPIQPLVLIALAGIVSLPDLPLAMAASHFSGSSSTPVMLTDALSFYPQLLDPVISGWILVAVSLSVGMSLAREPAVQDEGQFPLPTVLALAASACLPCGLFVLARLVTGGFLPRHVYAAAVAVCILLLTLAARAPVDKRWRGPILVMTPLLLLTISVARQARAAVNDHRDRIAFVQQLNYLQQETGQPVVLGDDGLFVELSYAYPQVVWNCYFLYGASGHSQADVTIPGLQRVMPLHAMTFNAWKAQHRSFVFLGNWMDPVLSRAVAERADLKYHTRADGLDYWTVQLAPGP